MSVAVIYWTTNLRQIMRKSFAKFQTADPCTRGSELANFSVTGVTARSRWVSCRLFKISGVVNNDLILFSMLVIYFKSYILVYFSSVKSMFRTAVYSEGLTIFLQGPLTEDPRSLLNAVNHIFQMFNFLKKINILFLLGVSRNAAFIYFPISFQLVKATHLKVQKCPIRWKSHWERSSLSVSSLVSHFRQAEHTQDGDLMVAVGLVHTIHSKRNSF